LKSQFYVLSIPSDLLKKKKNGNPDLELHSFAEAAVLEAGGRLFLED
jgi:hypothetical protein